MVEFLVHIIKLLINKTTLQRKDGRHMNITNTWGQYIAVALEVFADLK